MNKNNLSILVVVAGIAISSAIVGSALAQTQTALQPQEQKMPGDIQYPISELGNCANKEACKVFCDSSKNVDVCLKFAEERNLLSPEELASAKKFKDAGMIGPGGCKGQAECDKYCGNQDNMEECMTFAIKNGMMDPQKQAESKKVLAAIKRGVKMPSCKGQQECDKYCSSAEHMEECMNFSIEAGIMDEQKQAESKKVLAAIKRGVKMPACNGPTECDVYCSSSEHMEECITFGIEAGMMPPQEQENAKKTLAALKQGIKPPACQPNRPNQSGQSGQMQPIQANQSSQSGQGLQACDTYCGDPSHIEECVKFSVATGNMTEQQAQMAIKTGGKGPGGCINKDACDTFCNNPDNQETCFQFGKDNGMIPEADLKRMEKGQQKMKESFSQIPQEVLDCLTSSLGADIVEKMKSGSMVPQKAGETIGQCFQKYAPQGKMPNGQGQGGPGGQNNQGQPNQPGQSNQPNQQIQPWADMCSNNTELACVDGAGKFVTSAKVGSDEKPVCPEGSTAKCGNYQQNNQQGQSGQSGQNQPGPGVINPGNQQMPQQAGPGGCKGPEECQKYCASNSEECKNFQLQQNQPGQSGQPGQQGQIQPNQPEQPNQPGQPGGVGGPNEGQGFNPGSGQNGNGPGLGQGGAEDQKNQPGQFIQGQPGQSQQVIQGQPNQQMQPGQLNQLNKLNQSNQLNQPGQQSGQPNQPGQMQPGQQGQPGQFIQGQQGQMQPGQTQPQQSPQPQSQPQPPAQQQTPPSPPSGFLQTAQKLLGSVLDIFK